MDNPQQSLISALKTLLPLRVIVVTLEALSDCKPPFFHQAPLMAYLRFLANSPEEFDLYIRIDAPESGRIHYQAGDYYRFTLIGLAGSEPILNTLLQALSRLPQSAPKNDIKIPFRDNWQLCHVQMPLVKKLSNICHKQAPMTGCNYNKSASYGTTKTDSPGAGLPRPAC